MVLAAAKASRQNHLSFHLLEVDQYQVLAAVGGSVEKDAVRERDANLVDQADPQALSGSYRFVAKCKFVSRWTILNGGAGGKGKFMRKEKA